MNPLSKQLIETYRKYFKRERNTFYKIVIVNNHFDDVYSFFLYYKKADANLVHSPELISFDRDEDTFKQVLADFKSVSNLSIEYRDTRHLIHPGEDIVHDTVHGHDHSTQYQKQS